MHKLSQSDSPVWQSPQITSYVEKSIQNSTDDDDHRDRGMYTNSSIQSGKV